MDKTVVRENNNHNHQSSGAQQCPCCSVGPNQVGLLLERDDRLAERMEVVSKAVQFIQENAGQDINVADVVRAAGKSRARLDHYFKQVVGRTPAEEIRRARLKRAKHLLKKTNLPIPVVATMVGFGAIGNLVRAIKSETKLTPLRYRKQFRSQ